MKHHFRVETDNKIVLHKFYNNLELKERLFTDARNDSFYSTLLYKKIMGEIEPS